MPRKQSWERALLAAIGAPISPQNIKFLQNWQRWEGGHTHNSARFNWLNTTREAPGAIGNINRVGVKAFRDFQSGVAATRDTLLNGRYDDIVEGLKSGNPYGKNVAAGLSTWVSGSPTARLDYAQKVLGGTVSPKAARPRGGGGASSKRALVSAPPEIPQPDFLGIAFADDPEFLELLRLIPDRTAQKTGMVSSRGSVKPVRVPKGAVGGVVQAAQTQLGKPYVFGSGPSTESFDCSDLIQWAYKQIGVDIPRVTYDQIKAGREVKGQKLQPGDLIFPNTGHVVMYVGNGKVIAAPYTGTVVQYQPVSRFKNPISVRRIL